MNTQTDDALLSVQAASRRLGIDPRTIRKAVESGELRGYQPGRRSWYVHPSDLRDWLKRRRVGAER